YAWLARIHSIAVGQGWSQDRIADAKTALSLASQATRLDPANSIALATAGHVHSFLYKDYRKAESLLRKATRACPNEPLAWLLLSATLAYTGRASEAKEAALYALTLSPLDGSLYSFHTFAALASYVDHDYESACDFAQRAIENNERYSSSYKLLAASLVARGEITAARSVAQQLRILEPSYTYDKALAAPMHDVLARKLFALRLRTAGCFERRRRRAAA
ncbi:MAG: hypothetical protein JSS20_20020, partial [Proteobacteria bacterium]|nr:hypothetical protein [Pseudomonadota bacterium]